MKDEIRTLRPQYKIMRMILNQCDRLNRGKAIITLVVCTIIQSLLLSFSTGFFVRKSVPGGGLENMLGDSFGPLSLHSIIGMILLLFIAMTVCEILNYGLQVTCARMVEKSYVTLGYLFNGFREKKGRVLRMAAFYTLLSFIFGFGLVFLVLYFFKLYQTSGSSIDENTIRTFIVLGTGIYALILLILKLVFAFVYLILYRRPDCGVFRSIAISARLVFTQVFHFVGFLFYAAGKDLIALLVISIVMSLIPTDAHSSMGFLSMLLSCMQIVSQFRVLVRINLALPIYFYSMTGVLQVHGSDYVSPSDTKKDEIVLDGASVSITDAPDSNAEDANAGDVSAADNLTDDSADIADSNTENQSENESSL